MSWFIAFGATCITVLKEVNRVVTEPYMDEPFHVPQAQAYCNGDFWSWDPKITTPPGLYLASLLLKRIFLFKCSLPMLRLTPTLFLMALPVALTRLLCYHQRERPSASLLSTTPEAVVLGMFPIAWFFGFLYYTELPSLVTVILTVVSAYQARHWQAALLGLISCVFRQTNIIWVVYAYAMSQLMFLRFRHDPAGKGMRRLHDPSALEALPGDFVKVVISLPGVYGDIAPQAIPYVSVLLLFSAFVVWNEGIVLGDKSNHIPTIHIPQLYYFIASSTAFGWPVILSSSGGLRVLCHAVFSRMFGTNRQKLVTAIILASMCITVYLFTIHHPFLLSDNRHYTFYVWRRIYMFHRAVPYLLTPVYLACAWAWWLCIAREQTLLQTLVLPVCLLPVLLPTPLLEPRYFLIPYVLMRAQISDTPAWGVMLEGAWYILINAVTMFVFLYKERAGVGRFMW